MGVRIVHRGIQRRSGGFMDDVRELSSQGKKVSVNRTIEHQPFEGGLDGMELEKELQFWPLQDKSIQERGWLFTRGPRLPDRSKRERSKLYADFNPGDGDLQA